MKKQNKNERNLKEKTKVFVKDHWEGILFTIGWAAGIGVAAYIGKKGYDSILKHYADLDRNIKFPADRIREVAEENVKNLVDEQIFTCVAPNIVNAINNNRDFKETFVFTINKNESKLVTVMVDTVNDCWPFTHD